LSSIPKPPPPTSQDVLPKEEKEEQLAAVVISKEKTTIKDIENEQLYSQLNNLTSLFKFKQHKEQQFSTKIQELQNLVQLKDLKIRDLQNSLGEVTDGDDSKDRMLKAY